MFSKLLTNAMLVLVVAIAGSAIASLPLWVLWNWLVPDIFGQPPLSWLQAFGLLLLVNTVARTHLSVEWTT